VTGPALGKIPIELQLGVEGKNIDVEAYIHLKGFSRAMVTHLDIEGIDAKADKEGFYVVIIGTSSGFLIISKTPLKLNDVKAKKIYVKGIKLLNKGEKSTAWLGIKLGGFYLGFKKEIVKRLEEKARELAPEYFGTDSELNRFLD